MNIPPRTLFSLFAPCVALGAFAVFFPRKSKPVPQPVPKGTPVPLKVTFAGVRTEQVTPMHLFQGFDRHFSLVFKASGDHPNWWAKPVNQGSATTMRKWKFWLEQKGKRTPFKPERSFLSTSSWDATKKQYKNEVLLCAGSIPTNAALKMKGQTSLSIPGGTYTGTALPIEVTLKRAGEQWDLAPVSTNPTLLVRKIEIGPTRGGQTVGILTVGTTPGFDDTVLLTQSELLDGRLRPLRANVLSKDAVSRFGPAGTEIKIAPGTLQIWWSSSALKKSSARDVLLKCRLEQKMSWPLEVAFPIKKNGKLLLGRVPIYSYQFSPKVTVKDKTNTTTKGSTNAPPRLAPRKS